MKKSSQFGKLWFRRPRNIDKNWMNPTFYIDSCPISGRFFKWLICIMSVGIQERMNSQKEFPIKNTFHPGMNHRNMNPLPGIWILSPECESMLHKIFEKLNFTKVHWFLSNFRDLTSWINDTRAVISQDELAKDVNGAEALLERHAEHKSEIDAREDSFRATAEAGQMLLDSGNYRISSYVWGNTV